MSIAHLLEDFGIRLGLRMAQPALEVSQDDQEAIRLDAYEDGYKAGWDDAVSANKSEKMQISADLAQNIRDMTFTYQEACSQVTSSVGGVLENLSEVFLPEFSKTAFWPKVVDELEKMKIALGQPTFILHVSAGQVQLVERLSEELEDLSVSVQADSTLSAGQIVISTETEEVSIDFDALVAQAQNALRAGAHESEKELTYG